MIPNLPTLVTAALIALVGPGLRAQEKIQLSLDTSRYSPRSLAVSFTGVPETATTLLVLGYDRLAYFTTPEIPLYVQPVTVIPFGPSRTVALPYELLAPTAPTSYLQALSYDGANPGDVWASSKTWRLEAGRADVLGVDPLLTTWLVSTDSIPPHWTLMAKADVLPGGRSLRLAGIEPLDGRVRVYLRVSDTVDDAEWQASLGVPLGTSPGLEVEVRYGVGTGPFEQVALLPTRQP
jgi:hypothetical protein